MQRKITEKVQGTWAVDGAGVKLVRVLGPNTIKTFDPILMLDSFDSTNPADYTAGFPTHPHRGIETISYVSSGKMKHSDSLGFSDTVESGEVQWMTAGSGIMHEELVPASDRLLGVQLWLNLPQKDKMTTPKYHAIKAEEIQEIPFEGGYVRLLAGNYENYQGFQSEHLPFDYYDIHLQPNQSLTVQVAENRSVMAFTLLGDAEIAGEPVAEKTAVKLSEGTEITFSAGDKPAQILFMSSLALKESVAWGGPIVMNTEAELREAFAELRTGRFLKEKMQ